MEFNLHKKEEVFRWLLKSTFVKKTQCGNVFSLSEKTKGRLKNGKIVNVNDWLFEGGVFTYIHELGYYTRYSHTNNARYGKTYFTKIPDIRSLEILGLMLDKSACEIYSPKIDENTLIRIKDELSNYTNISNDQNKIIEPTDGVLSWVDKDTGLVWDALRLFDESNMSYPRHFECILNKLYYAGFNDWRIATFYELRTIATKKRNGLFHIKNPLQASSSEACWADAIDTHNSDRYAYDFMENREVVDRYYRDESIYANTLCVRGKIKISSKEWVNTLSNWAAREDLCRFPTEEKEIINLVRLESYHRYREKLDIPSEIGNLIHLETLILSYNNILEVPNFIFKLKNLKKIYFSSNNIKEIPDQLCILRKLESIDFGNNDIASIPKEIIQFRNINYLNLCGNPRLTLSKEQKEWIRTLDNNGARIMRDANFKKIVGF